MRLKPTAPFLFFILLIATDVSSAQKTAVAVLPDKTRLHLELADTPQTMTRGLMFRKKLAPDGGMLFVYETERFPSIWMKNCFIHMDILWLSSEGRIVYFEKNVPPCRKNPCATYAPLSRAKYVMEIHAHTIAKHNLQIGDSIELVR